MLKNILIILFSVIIILIFTVNVNLNNKAFDVVATFLSITTGFTITALSIIATSPFSKNLYGQESKKNNSKTLLHELVDKFKISMILFIVTICFITFLNLFNENYVGKTIKIFNNKTTTLEILKSTILYFSILSLISFIILFNTFSKFVIKSGKSIN
jgi:hypothetical protein